MYIYRRSLGQCNASRLAYVTQSAVNSEVYDPALLLSLPFDDLFRNMDERVYAVCNICWGRIVYRVFLVCVFILERQNLN